MAVEKGNIFLSDTAETMPFASRPGIGSVSYPSRDRCSHANFVRGKLQGAFEADKEQKSAAAFRHKEGVYLEFLGSPEHHLAIQSLENRRQGIRLLNVRKEKTGEEPDRMTATVYIPAGKESYFLNKVEQYATESTSKGKPRNNDLIRSIDDIKLAVLRSFWIGGIDNIPSSSPVWCEVWLCDVDGTKDSTLLSKAEEGFLNVCDELGIRYSEGRISFPERLVKLIHADRESLDKLLVSCPDIAEIRRAQQPASFFVNLASCEQKEWIDDLLSRTRFLNSDVAVCILDTGLAFSHPLIKKAVDEDHVQSLEDSWGTGDTCGHGTAMAGIALYGDLKEALEGASNVFVPQRLESVKILPPRGENPYELYGDLTQQAVYLSEISNPEAARVFCLAVTSSEYNTPDGAPTSWSGAIDSVTSAADKEGTKRLFFISAGNVELKEFFKSPYPESSLSHGVESPGQSWNALTVGAYAKDISIADSDHDGFFPLAGPGQLSPYSSTSRSWDYKWPIKPEILLDGGNVAASDYDYTNCDDLSILTTKHAFLLNYFTTISGTSPATAQAAWMGARLMAEYPGPGPRRYVL